MKSGLYAVQKKPYAGAVPLESFRTQRHEQCLDVIPDYAGVHRVVENRLQRLAVLAGHKNLVSLSDTVVNGFVGLHKNGGRPYLTLHLKLDTPGSNKSKLCPRNSPQIAI